MTVLVVIAGCVLAALAVGALWVSRGSLADDDWEDW